MGNSESKVLIDLQANASKVHDRLKTASKVIMKQYDKKKFDALIKKNEEDAEELLKGDPRYVYLVADKRNLIKFKKSFEDVLTYFFDATKNWENWNNFSEDFKLQWLQDLIIETKKYVESVHVTMQRLLLGVGLAVVVGFIEIFTGFLTNAFKFAIKSCKSLTQPYLQTLTTIGTYLFPAVGVAVMEAIVTALTVGFAIYMGYQLVIGVKGLYDAAVLFLRKTALNSTEAACYRQILQHYSAIDANFVPL